MKKLASILLFLSCLVIHVKAAYLPISYKGHFYQYQYDAGLGQVGMLYQTIQCDTLINSLLYFKVFFTDVNGNNAYYDGAIREDTLTQKVYFIDHDSTQESILFDYSLQVNDSIYTQINGTTRKAHVDSVVTSFLYGQTRKVIYFDSIPSFIEGIGSSLWGLHGRPFATSGFLASGKIVASTTVAANCYPTKLSDQHVEMNNLIIYPNPASDELFIKFDQQHTGELNYLISNMLGMKIRDGKLVGNVISMRGLLPGIYQLQINSNQIHKREIFAKQ